MNKFSCEIVAWMYESNQKKLITRTKGKDLALAIFASFSVVFLVIDHGQRMHFILTRDTVRNAGTRSSCPFGSSNSRLVRFTVARAERAPKSLGEKWKILRLISTPGRGEGLLEREC